MKTRVFLRCDGGTHIGMGHVVRCLALANMLREHFTICFLVQKTDESVYEWITSHGFTYTLLERTSDESTDILQTTDAINRLGQKNDIVVLDGYHLQTRHQQAIQEHGFKVAAIDDLHAWHHVANAVINHAPGIAPASYDTETHTRLLLGLDYVLLRPELIAATQVERTIQPPTQFLVSMGAADEHNRTHLFTQLIIEKFADATVHMLVSSLNPHLEQLKEYQQANATRVHLHLNLQTTELVDRLLKTDVVVCPASTISLEACAAGCTLITGYTAQNQLGILAGLVEKSAALSLGSFLEIEETEAANRIQHLLNDATVRHNQLLAQRSLIDGRSGLRIACSFMEIARNAHVRFANTNDAKLYFKWANDPEVRANSYQTEPIEWPNHEEWFSRAVASPEGYLLVYSIDDIPAGQMRLKLENDTAVINYSVDATFRGQGLGKWLLEHIAVRIAIDKPLLKFIEGWVKKTNEPSMRAFQASGYAPAEETADSVLFRRNLSRH